MIPTVPDPEVPIRRPLLFVAGALCAALTVSPAAPRLDKDWDDEVKAYDAVYDHILKMADALADAIIKQFPNKFTS